MALTKIGAGLFKDTLKTNVSGALGDNATLIRSLTEAGVSGSFSQTHLSSKISGIVSGAAQIADNISGSFSQTHLSSKISGIVSASVLSSPSQGTIRLATNGVNTDVDSGLQAGDSPTFAGGTVTGNLTVGGTLTAQEIHTEFTSASIMFSSGSTKFGDTIDDTHEVTGSMTMSGSVTVNDGDLIVTDNIGIGTSTVVSQLHLAKTSGEFGIKLTNNATGHTSSDGVHFNLDGNNDLNLGTKDSTNIVFKTADSERVRIKSDGKVGIGTNNPGRLLDLVALSDAVALNLRMRSADDFSFITFTDNDAGEAFISQIASKRTGTGAGEMQFYTSGDNLRMVIDNSGDVGIGTNSPSKLFHVEKSTGGDFLARIKNTDSTNGEALGLLTNNTTATSRLLHAENSSGRVFTIYNDAKVLIGNNDGFTASSASLHIAQNEPSIRLQDMNHAPNTFCMFNANSGAGGLEIIADANNTNAGSNIDFQVDGGSKMVISGSGQIGMGTSNPSQFLDLTFAGEDGMAINSTNSNATLFLQSNGTNKWIIANAPSQHELFISSETVAPIITIEQAGDVGIGTNNPTVKLHVKEDNSDDDAQIKVENDGDGDAGVAFLLTGTRGYSMGIDNSDGDKFIIGGDDNAIGTTPYLTIDHSTSHVGIGCTDPEATLQVNSGVSDATLAAIDVGIGIEFNGGTGGHVGMAVIDGSAGRGKNRGFIGFRGKSASSMGHSHIVFATAPGVADDPVEIMRITTTGKVGIGQDDPSAGKLEIRVTGDGERGLQITNTDTNQTSSDETMRISLAGDTSPSNPRLIGFEDGDSQMGGIVATSGTTVEYSTSSDYRLKENEQLITDGLERVKKLKPYKFNWKTLPDKIVDGFFAHEVAEVVPEAVIGEKDATKIHDRTEREIVDPQLLNVSRLVPILVASVQELSSQVNVLKAQISGSSDFTSLKTAVSGSN